MNGAKFWLDWVKMQFIVRFWLNWVQNTAPKFWFDWFLVGLMRVMSESVLVGLSARATEMYLAKSWFDWVAC